MTDRLLDLDRLDEARWAGDAAALRDEAEALAAIEARDPALAAALRELPREARAAALGGYVDDEAEQLLGAIAGAGWAHRLAAAAARHAGIAREE